MRSPSAIISLVAPAGTGRLAVSAAEPASGCVPSGGFASSALTLPAGADAPGRGGELNPAGKSRRQKPRMDRGRYPPQGLEPGRFAPLRVGPPDPTIRKG